MIVVFLVLDFFLLVKLSHMVAKVLKITFIREM